MSAATVVIAPREIAGLALADHVIAMADDAYLTGHPEWQALVTQAREFREATDKPFRVSVLLMGGYGQSFSTLDDALIYATSEANSLNVDDLPDFEGIDCENQQTSEEWTLIWKDGWSWTSTPS